MNIMYAVSTKATSLGESMEGAQAESRKKIRLAQRMGVGGSIHTKFETSH